MPISFYPLLLKPLLRNATGGTGRLGRFLQGPLTADMSGSPECWGVIDDGPAQSEVLNGSLAGKTLGELTRLYKSDLVGRRHPNTAPFPVCVRVREVTAEQPLAVHPPTERRGGDGQENAKFWYVLEADEQASVTAGLAQRAAGQQVRSKLDTPALMRLLQTFASRAGDAFLIPPGIVHGMSAGNLIWEVQQSNTEPYRLSYLSGKSRIPADEQKRALEAILLTARQNPRISREASSLSHTRKIMLTPHCPYFNIEEIRLHDHMFSRTGGDSFHLLTVIHGKAVITYDADSWPLDQGCACIVPASLGDYKVENCGDPAVLLRVTQP
jgi:mannose-6-phosphate isomerase